MGLFKKSSQTSSLNSNEFESCLKRIADLKADVDFLKTEMAQQKTNLTSLRGLFNRRLNKDEDDDENDKYKNNSMFIG